MITRFFYEYHVPYSSLKTGLQTRLFIKTGRARIDKREGKNPVRDATDPAACRFVGGFTLEDPFLKVHSWCVQDKTNTSGVSRIQKEGT